MFRSALRPYLALLLLLCLGRTLLPEAWVLAWHPHRHTTHELAYAGRRTRSSLLFTARHQHCHAEQFYNVPFAAASIVELAIRRGRPCYNPRPVARVRACPRPVRPATGQRGPPTGASGRWLGAGRQGGRFRLSV